MKNLKKKKTLYSQGNFSVSQIVEPWSNGYIICLNLLSFDMCIPYNFIVPPRILRIRTATEYIVGLCVNILKFQY